MWRTALCGRCLGVVTLGLVSWCCVLLDGDGSVKSGAVMQRES